MPIILLYLSEDNCVEIEIDPILLTISEELKENFSKSNAQTIEFHPHRLVKDIKELYDAFNEINFIFLTNYLLHEKYISQFLKERNKFLNLLNWKNSEIDTLALECELKRTRILKKYEVHLNEQTELLGKIMGDSPEKFKNVLHDISVEASTQKEIELFDLKEEYESKEAEIIEEYETEVAPVIEEIQSYEEISNLCGFTNFSIFGVFILANVLKADRVIDNCLDYLVGDFSFFREAEEWNCPLISEEIYNRFISLGQINNKLTTASRPVTPPQKSPQRTQTAVEKELKVDLSLIQEADDTERTLQFREAMNKIKQRASERNAFKAALLKDSSDFVAMFEENIKPSPPRTRPGLDSTKISDIELSTPTVILPQTKPEIVVNSSKMDSKQTKSKKNKTPLHLLDTVKKGNELSDKLKEKRSIKSPERKNNPKAYHSRITNILAEKHRKRKELEQLEVESYMAIGYPSEIKVDLRELVPPEKLQFPVAGVSDELINAKEEELEKVIMEDVETMTNKVDNQLGNIANKFSDIFQGEAKDLVRLRKTTDHLPAQNIIDMAMNKSTNLTMFDQHWDNDNSGFGELMRVLGVIRDTIRPRDLELANQISLETREYRETIDLEHDLVYDLPQRAREHLNDLVIFVSERDHMFNEEYDDDISEESENNDVIADLQPGLIVNLEELGVTELDKAEAKMSEELEIIETQLERSQRMLDEEKKKSAKLQAELEKRKELSLDLLSPDFRKEVQEAPSQHKEFRDNWIQFCQDEELRQEKEQQAQRERLQRFEKQHRQLVRELKLVQENVD
eukprot:TRINITY_DN2778_c0_g3_i1.p1 TRINITY_DN2778_c0_g3~~TRINITY_DN2778_c0_g3_i1.p1  ORF type:complete len:809 (+),score=260.83 TRINITY_DN2778_c0_g3_i1:34-2427(+)